MKHDGNIHHQEIAFVRTQEEGCELRKRLETTVHTEFLDVK